MTTIAMAPLMQAESSSHNHSFEIYQKYKHPKTLTREVKTWSIVPKRTYWPLGKTSIR